MLIFFGKYHNLEELRKYVPDVTQAFNSELQDLIWFEKTLQLNDYKQLDTLIKFFKSNVKENKVHLIKHHEERYKQIEDFVKLKTEALRVSYVKNDQTVLAKYTDKLCLFKKFLDDIPYFTNNPAKKFLEKKIQESLVKGAVTEESFEDFAKGYKLPIEETIAGLFRAIDENDNEAISYLLKSGKINLNEALFEAVGQDHAGRVKFLVEQNIDLEVTIGDYKKTALHMASRKYFPEGIKLLLAKGANIDALDISGGTPLHYATRESLADIAQLLFENGAKHLGDKDGKTPLHIAIGNYHLYIMKYFLQQGISPNVKDKYDQTPLHDAASGMKKDAVELLLQYGADLGAKTNGNAPYPNHIPVGMAVNPKILGFLKIATACYYNDFSKLDISTLIDPIFDFWRWKQAVTKNLSSNLDSELFKIHLNELEIYKQYLISVQYIAPKHAQLVDDMVTLYNNHLEANKVNVINEETPEVQVELGGVDLTHDA